MLIPINPEKISNTPSTMTPVNPADPGSPTGPTLENKAHSENSIEKTGKSPQSDPVPERRYEPSLSVFDMKGENRAESMVAFVHQKSKAVIDFLSHRDNLSPQASSSLRNVS